MGLFRISQCQTSSFFVLFVVRTGIRKVDINLLHILLAYKLGITPSSKAKGSFVDVCLQIS